MTVVDIRVKRSLRYLMSRAMQPRLFCKRWFNTSNEDELERGYRAKCVKLLAQILKLEVNTVERWGSGIDFDKMPEQHTVTLSYADTLREMIEAASTQGDLLKLVLERLNKSM